jgi:hypothetical protein
VSVVCRARGDVLSAVGAGRLAGGLSATAPGVTITRDGARLMACRMGRIARGQAAS